MTTRRLFYYGPVAIWLILIFFASTQAGAEQATLRAIIRILKMLSPDQASILGSDTMSKVNFIVRKMAHISEYAVLALLAVRALQSGAQRLKWQSVLGGLLAPAIYALSDEFHQSFVPGRTASIHDVVIDTFGAAIALLLMSLWFGVKAFERSRFPFQANAHEPSGSAASPASSSLYPANAGTVSGKNAP